MSSTGTKSGLQANVSLLLAPAPCSAATSLLLLISSGPASTTLRAGWRARAALHRNTWPGLRLVFMVARAAGAGQQAELARESQEWGDILQPDTADGHRRLGYKATD